MNLISEWLRLATRPVVVKRAARTAVVVGAILIAINHGSEILSGRITSYGLLQICLTITVPYLVSTSSSVATLRNMMAEGSNSGAPSLRPDGYIPEKMTIDLVPNGNEQSLIGAEAGSEDAEAAIAVKRGKPLA